MALITGSTRGIGWATANLLARHGATVLLNGQTDSETLRDRVAEIRSTYKTEADGFGFEVGSPDAIKECYAAIFRKYKRLDILVNNAGILDEGLLAMVTAENLQRTFHVNVQGVILNMQYASRLMARNGGGTIINLSSILGRVGNAGTVVYSASKAAVIGVTLSAAKELASAGIRVNAVAPGLIDTDMTKRLTPEKLQEKLKGIAMRRIGTSEDVANAVLYLASNLSSYVTGQVLGVDGGMVV